MMTEFEPKQRKQRIRNTGHQLGSILWPSLHTAVIFMTFIDLPIVHLEQSIMLALWALLAMSLLMMVTDIATNNRDTFRWYSARDYGFYLSHKVRNAPARYILLVGFFVCLYVQERNLLASLYILNAVLSFILHFNAKKQNQKYILGSYILSLFSKK